MGRMKDKLIEDYGKFGPDYIQYLETTLYNTEKTLEEISKIANSSFSNECRIIAHLSTKHNKEN